MATATEKVVYVEGVYLFKYLNHHNCVSLLFISKNIDICEKWVMTISLSHILSGCRFNPVTRSESSLLNI